MNHEAPGRTGPRGFGRSIRATAPLALLLTCLSMTLATSSQGTVPLSAAFEEAGIARQDSVPGARLLKCGLVLEPGPAGAWDAGMVESPVVWYDSLRRRYGMVYTGYGLRDPEVKGYEGVTWPQIGLAWSDDLLHWEKAPDILLGPSAVPGSPDEAGATGPFIWYEGGTYYLFYFGVTAAGYEKGRKTLNLATSTDLVRWTRYAGNPIITPAGNGWRRDAIWHPNVVKVDARYYLFFNASGVVDGVEEERIGYATSSDLFNWEVDDLNAPVLSGSGVPGAWDATGRAGDPSLYRVGDTWYMAYYSWDREHAQDGLAWTSADAFPLGWRAYAGNPVLRIGPPGSFDARYAHKPFIFRTEERHFHFYTAVAEDETRAIALATWPGPCADPENGGE